MASDLNQCNFIGRLGADVDGRFMPNGDAVANFRIAVGWKTKDKEGAEWVSVVAFGKLGQVCIDYLKKGSKVFISGRFKTEKYTNKDGVETYSTKIMADQMQMLDSKPSSAPSSEAPRQTQSAPQPNEFDDMSDVPF